MAGGAPNELCPYKSEMSLMPGVHMAETLSRVASESKSKCQVAHVPMNVSTDLSFELAERIISTLDTMEGPTLITSA